MLACQISSRQHSEVSKLAPFEYLSLIFAVIADFALFSIVPGGAFYLSTLLIVIAMWAIAARDHRKNDTDRPVEAEYKQTSQT